MADDNKVYTQEVILETPIPSGDTTVVSPVDHGSATTEVYSQTTVDETMPPTKQIATELISSTLNTKTRKILKEITFTPTGAIQIGDYQQGKTGDIRISPDGLVARNVNGDVTVAVDGDTGDAVFAGTLQSGALVAGVVRVGDGNIVIDGINRRQVWYSADGLSAIVIGNV